MDCSWKDPHETEEQTGGTLPFLGYPPWLPRHVNMLLNFRGHKGTNSLVPHNWPSLLDTDDHWKSLKLK